MARNVKVEEPSKAVSSAALAGRLQAVEAQTKQSSERIYYVSGRDVFVSLHTGSSSLYAVLCYLLLCCATCCCLLCVLLFDKSLRKTVQHCSLQIAMAAYTRKIT